MLHDGNLPSEATPDGPTTSESDGESSHEVITPPPLTAAGRAELTEAIARFRELQQLTRETAIHWTSSPDDFAAGCSGWRRRGGRTRLPPCWSYQRHLHRRHRGYWGLRQIPAVLFGIMSFGFWLVLALAGPLSVPLILSSPKLEGYGVGQYALLWLGLGAWLLLSCWLLLASPFWGWDTFRGGLTDETVRSLRIDMPEFARGRYNGFVIRSDAVTLYPSFRPGTMTGSVEPAADDHVAAAGRRDVAVLAAYSVLDRYGVTCAFLRYLTIVLEPPSLLRVEVTPHRTRRLHAVPAPAVEWRSGTPWYAVHGVRVDQELITGKLSVWGIHRLDNSEVRRTAIERKGWARYLAEAGLEPVAEADDPANPGARLQLFDLPDSNVRILVMRNGSPDRSGEHRTYAEPVPRHFHDPVAAAAWQYGCPTDVYRQLRRRT